MPSAAFQQEGWIEVLGKARGLHGKSPFSYPLSYRSLRFPDFDVCDSN